MKNLYEYIIEGVLDANLEDTIDSITVKDYVDAHKTELFKSSFGKLNVIWTSKGLDCTDVHVNWVEVVDLWNRGIKIPFAKVKPFSTGRFYDGFDAVPEDSKDFDILLNEVLAKTKFDVMVDLDSEINSDMIKMMQHPGVDQLSLWFKDLTVPLSKIPFNKIKAKYISLFDNYSYKPGRIDFETVFDYEAISGWKGKRLRLDYTFGLVDTSDWYQGISRTIKFNDDNKAALDYLFSKNNFKDIMVNCMGLYGGTNRACGGRPYYAYITKSGSEYEYKLK